MPRFRLIVLSKNIKMLPAKKLECAHRLKRINHMVCEINILLKGMSWTFNQN